MATHPLELLKEKSRHLRGTLLETLQSDVSHFTVDEYNLLKFHGSYQQDDRDRRLELKKAGLDKAWILMLRTKLPGGRLTASQYLVLDKLCHDIANGTMRITNRQGIQFHGILKKNFKEAVQRINASGITTWGACGDVVRNTMASPSPISDVAHRDIQELAREFSNTFLSKSRAYTEIWLDGEPLSPHELTEEKEPIYGDRYLPRKFKIGIAIPPRNDTDILTQDLAFVAHTTQEGSIEGYTVLAGGSFGMSHGNIATFPALAQPLFYIKKQHAVETAIAVVMAQRDHGNREDRKRARLKYVIATKGVAWFRDEVKKRLQCPTEAPRPFTFTTVGDLLGWHEQGDGKLFCGVWVGEGRIRDIEKGPHYRAAFQKIAEHLGCPIHLTPNCNILFCDISPSQKEWVNKLLADHNVVHTDSFTEARKISHACVALPTCGLALSESERVFPKIMDELDAILRELKIEKEEILIRMSGCPNGCSRPYNADIAFVGRGPGKYALFVGGSSRGDRLAGLELKMVEEKNLIGVLRPLLSEFATQRKPGERFSDFWKRTHINGPAPSPEQFHFELAERAARLAAERPSPVSA